MEDVFYLDVEDSWRKTHWCQQFLSGICNAAKRKRARLCETGEALPEESSPIVILLGTSSAWLFSRLKEWSELHARCVVVSFPLPVSLPDVSHVSMDYARATRELMAHLYALGERRIALFGANPASAPDSIKREAFLAFSHLKGNEHVFLNRGNIGDACAEFMERAGEYDAVICVNDILALALSRRLKDGQSLRMAAFGTTPEAYSGLKDRQIITARLDFEQAGRQTLGLCRMLRANPEMSSVNALLSCKIRGGASDADIRDVANAFDAPEVPEMDFYGDAEAEDILRMEKMLMDCDELDIGIIRTLMQGCTYSRIADELFVSESTVNYRLKKLFAAAATPSREGFITFCKKYY